MTSGSAAGGDSSFDSGGGVINVSGSRASSGWGAGSDSAAVLDSCFFLGLDLDLDLDSMKISSGSHANGDVSG